MAKKAQEDRVFIQNAVRTLATNIRFASVDNPVRSIVVTSSIPNEGKTTIATNLAQALASGGKTVLIVECDIRRRSPAVTLGTHARNGIYAVLSGQVDLDDAVVARSPATCGSLTPSPTSPTRWTSWAPSASTPSSSASRTSTTTWFWTPRPFPPSSTPLSLAPLQTALWLLMHKARLCLALVLALAGGEPLWLLANWANVGDIRLILGTLKTRPKHRRILSGA